ncbi:MAG TPA: hypothetical protein VMZ27_18520 [Candidatus Saccharimonadales bacterium]|nr:hypothetical protein [Candidatus Saccharimonadales bacterium]
MKLSTKIILTAFISLLLLGFWIAREPEDSIIRRSYLNLHEQPAEHQEIVRNTNELAVALKKYARLEHIPLEYAAIDFVGGYVILTSNKEVVRVSSKLGFKIVSLKSLGSNGIGLAIMHGNKEPYFKFTEDRRVK